MQTKCILGTDFLHVEREIEREGKRPENKVSPSTTQMHRLKQMQQKSKKKGYTCTFQFGP